MIITWLFIKIIEQRLKLYVRKHGVFEQVPESHMKGIGCKKCSNKDTYTTEEFINKAKVKQGNKYDYSLVKYKNSHTKVEIICSIHGIFKQKPNRHLHGDKCPNCSISKKSNTIEFIKNSILKHGNKYDYSLVEYENSKSEIDIICSKHGLFKQTPNQHLKSKGCVKCLGNYSLTNKEFIEKSILKHGFKYNYTLVRYENMKSKIDIICSKHGIFSQKSSAHLDGNGCPKCSGKNKTSKEFIEECLNIHKGIYSYQNTEYVKSSDKIIVTCSMHGDFKQKASTHLSGHGCPKCKSSKGELKIMEYLIKNNINHFQEYNFNDCRIKLPLKFDFYLPKHNICIEYDGVQHFKSIDFFGGYERLKYTQLCDSIKDTYCIDNSINLIRISYNNIDNITSILSEKIKK